MNAFSALGIAVGGVSFGFAGFAFGLFATTSLALVAAPASVVPAVMLLADVMSAALLWEHRHELSARHLREAPGFARWSPVMLVAGVVAGTVLLGSVAPAVGRLALAAVVLVFVVLQMRPEHRHAGERRSSPAMVEATTFAAGLLDGWIGTGGVTVAAHLAWRRLPSGRFLAAILPYFFASDALRVVSYAIAGYWSREVFALWLTAAPFAAAGYLGGVFLRRRISSPAVFRAVVLVLLTLYGAALAVRAILD